MHEMSVKTTTIHPRIISDETIWSQSDFKALYFQKLLKNTNYVLCSVSAAEYLGLCNCTTAIETYVLSKEECIANNIQIVSTDGTLHTDISQTINDLLADKTMDEQVILESLADQYFKNNYADITITLDNQAAFNYYKPMAEMYYHSEI